jgi:hypothetical protein
MKFFRNILVEIVLFLGLPGMLCLKSAAAEHQPYLDSRTPPIAFPFYKPHDLTVPAVLNG